MDNVRHLQASFPGFSGTFWNRSSFLVTYQNEPEGSKQRDVAIPE